MKSDSDSIPKDINELTSLVKELRKQVTHQSLFIDQLLEQIKLARHQRFGVRSEHISPDQLRLLLDDKANDESPVDNNTDDSDENPLSQPSAKPKKRGRRKLPDHLPRVDVEHTLDEVRHEVRTDLEVKVLPRKPAHGIEYRVLSLWR